MKEKPFNPSRRGFIRDTTLAAAGIAVGSRGLENFYEDKSIKPEEILSQEEIYFLEELPYPDESEVPELMRAYHKKFKSWVEVAVDQKKKVLDYVSSNRYKNLVYEELKTYFDGEKDDTELGNITEDLIEDRKSNLRLKDKFQKLDKGYIGQYFANKKFAFDTLQNVPHAFNPKDSVDDSYETKEVNMTVCAHEYHHGTQHPNLMLMTTFNRIIECLERGSTLSLEEIKSGKFPFVSDKELETEKKSAIPLKNGRVSFKEDKIGELLPYKARPHEVMSFLMEIRMAMHLLWETKQTQGLKFNMNEDDFTAEHFEFLDKNKKKIFVQFNYADEQRTDTDIILKYLQVFKKEDLIYLINKIV